MARFVDRTIEAGPFSFDFHIRLIESPAPSHRTLPAAELFFKLRGILDDPAIERGMIHGNTPLAHHLLELPIRNRIRYVPPHAPHENFPLKLTTLEIDHAASPPPHDQWRSIAESPSSENLRQNRSLAPSPGLSGT